MSNKPNKFDMINVVNISTLDAKDKILLVELIMRSNIETNEAFPGVARLCQTRGIKNAKNFKGVDTYLPGLVTVQKNPGKRNSYFLVPEAIMALPQAEVNTEKYRSSNPPAVEGVTAPTPLEYPASEANPPAVEGYYPPAVEGYYPPAVEGSNSSVDSSVNISPNNKEMSVMSSSPGENQGGALVETKSPLVFPGKELVSSGDTKREVIEEIGISPLVDEVTANAAPSTISSGEKNVDVDNETVTTKDITRTPHPLAPRRAAAPRKKEPVKVVDAPLSASGAEPGAKVQTVPEKPQKPVYEVPNRNPYHDDFAHERRVHNAEVAFNKAMGKWRQDMKVWEAKYGDSPSTESETTNSSTTPTLSPQSSERLAKYSALRVQAHAY